VFERGRQLLKEEISGIVSSWKGVLGVPFWVGLGPTKRPGPTNYKLDKGAHISFHLNFFLLLENNW